MFVGMFVGYQQAELLPPSILISDSNSTTFVRLCTNNTHSTASAITRRCNVDAEQRADFVSLAAAAGAPCHCLVLGLQQQLCLARASARQGHEGGVEGKAAALVVGQMAAQLKKAGRGYRIAPNHH
jgi:hypothetical protein